MDGPSLLAAYLDRNGLSLRAFAEKVEAPVALVWRWRRGKGTPGNTYILAIDAATGGAVPASAWLKAEDAQLVRRVVRRAARRASGESSHRKS